MSIEIIGIEVGFVVLISFYIVNPLRVPHLNAMHIIKQEGHRKRMITRESEKDELNITNQMNSFGAMQRKQTRTGAAIHSQEEDSRKNSNVTERTLEEEAGVDRERKRELEKES